MLPLKHLDLKHFHSFFFVPKQAFTLVELIVVISVLGVLATIAFTQISNVTLSARNSTRMTNLQSISSSLNLYIATNGVYPIPDNKTDILYSGSTIGYQWYIKDTAARILKLSPSSSQDPLNTSSYFSYATNASRTDAQILGFLEKDTSTGLKALPATFASDELSTKTPYSKGEELGILYVSGTTTPLSGTGIDVSTTASVYTAYYNSTDSLSGTGNALQNLLISYSYGAGYGSPATDDCPTGFIPVPGNKDFNQPGFCVAKYEMKQAIGDAGNYYLSGTWQPSWNQSSPYCTNTSLCSSTGARNFSSPIVSKADGYPIVYLTQYNAIEACKAMWEGYHLITNNEWMTVARNTESVKANWISNIIWSGAIYGWHNDGTPALALVASSDDTQGFLDTGNSSGTQKRTLTLSNGQIIWDFAGNIYENVNKANTISGLGYNSSTFWVSNICGGTNWYSLSGNDWLVECAYTNGYTYANMWPLTPNLNSANGLGRIYSNTSIVNNIFLRGWLWGNTVYSGIFALYMQGDSYTHVGTGFRCAK